MVITINGAPYKVGVAEVKRDFTFETKYNLTTEDGVKHREISGLYRAYSLVLGNINKDTYDALLNAFLTADEYVTVTLPDGKTGSVTYEAFVDSISDELIKDYNGVRFWDKLVIKFDSREPIATADDRTIMIDAEIVAM